MPIVRSQTEQVEPNNKTAHCAGDPLPVEGAGAGDGVGGGSPPLDTVAAFVGHEPRGGNGSNKREDSPPQRESCVGVRTPWMTLKVRWVLKVACSAAVVASVVVVGSVNTSAIAALCVFPVAVSSLST